MQRDERFEKFIGKRMAQHEDLFAQASVGRPALIDEFDASAVNVYRAMRASQVGQNENLAFTQSKAELLSSQFDTFSTSLVDSDSLEVSSSYIVSAINMSDGGDSGSEADTAQPQTAAPDDVQRDSSPQDNSSLFPSIDVAKAEYLEPDNLDYSSLDNRPENARAAIEKAASKRSDIESKGLQVHDNPFFYTKVGDNKFISGNTGTGEQFAENFDVSQESLDILKAGEWLDVGSGDSKDRIYKSEGDGFYLDSSGSHTAEELSKKENASFDVLKRAKAGDRVSVSQVTRDDGKKEFIWGKEIKSQGVTVGFATSAADSDGHVSDFGVRYSLPRQSPEQIRDREERKAERDQRREQIAQSRQGDMQSPADAARSRQGDAGQTQRQLPPRPFWMRGLNQVQPQQPPGVPTSALAGGNPGVDDMQVGTATNTNLYSMDALGQSTERSAEQLGEFLLAVAQALEALGVRVSQAEAILKRSFGA